MQQVAPDHPHLHHRGWTDRRAPSSTRLVWAGTGISLRFDGASIAVELRGTGMIEILLDGRLAHLLGPDLPGRIELADRLPEGEHVVEVRKRGEPVSGLTRFEGFVLPDDARTLEPATPVPYLLFLGDSITCGYGNLASGPEQSFAPETEDVFRSYAGIACERLGLEFQASAWSGKGLQRNFDRDGSPTIPQLWRLANPFDTTSTCTTLERPLLAVINLGSNDVYHDDPDWSSFEHDMIAFAREIRSVFPGIPLLLLDGPLLADGRLRSPDGTPRPVLTRLQTALDRAAESLDTDAPTARFSLEPTADGEPMGADHHPSLDRQRIGGEALANALRPLLAASGSGVA